MKNTSEKFDEDEMFDLFEQSEFSRVIDFVNKYGVNSVDRDGRNILLNFIIEHKIDFALKIIKLDGIDLNQQDKNGFSALHFSAQENLIKITKALIDESVKIDILDQNGNTPLWRAFFDGVDEDLILLLLKRGADINKKNNSGVPPIEFLDKSMSLVKKWLKENHQDWGK